MIINRSMIQGSICFGERFQVAQWETVSKFMWKIWIMRGKIGSIKGTFKRIGIIRSCNMILEKFIGRIENWYDDLCCHRWNRHDDWGEVSNTC